MTKECNPFNLSKLPLPWWFIVLHNGSAVWFQQHLFQESGRAAHFTTAWLRHSPGRFSLPSFFPPITWPIVSFLSLHKQTEICNDIYYIQWSLRAKLRHCETESRLKILCKMPKNLWFIYFLITVCIIVLHSVKKLTFCNVNFSTCGIYCAL